MADESNGTAKETLPPSGSQRVAGDQDIVLARDVRPTVLPIIPLQHRPLFPKLTVPMVIDDAPLVQVLVETVQAQQKVIGLVLRRHADDASPTESPAGRDLCVVGVVAEILHMAQLAGENGKPIAVQFIIGVLDRIRIERIVQDAPYVLAEVSYVIETEMTANDELKAYSLSVVRSIKELIQLNPLHKEELSLFMTQSSLGDPGRLADFAAALTSASGRELQEVLETVSIRERLRKALVLIKKEIDISKIQVRIGKQIEEKLSKQQREFFLREQLKAIKKELGIEKEGKETEVERFEKRLTTLTLPAEAGERIQEELDKLRLIEPSSPEFHVTRTYLDWLTGLPWGICTPDNYDLVRAGKILNQDHYGLEDVKERILEFLAVGSLKGKISGSILCFVGPPGVGKTSIGQSIARSIGRTFYRFSLGGMRDEAEIKGHRRTYIGALPGKFIQAIKVCKCSNPVIMLDEVDKIGASYQGDPASALLEVLDPEQNRDFLDHYLDVRFDLSNVFFICTANQLDTIPRPLLDRMEVIKLAGYMLKEKLEIGRRFLVPKQLKAHGVKRRQVTITAGALREMADGYAREPGVRSLENHIKKVIRKVVKELVGGAKTAVRLEAGDVAGYLGKRSFTDEPLYPTPVPGVVTGLAWTSLGGETLYVEATKVHTNKGGFKQTGQLGNVMIESSEIAFTFVRSYLDEDEAARKFFEEHYIHLHVPAGATPKDGPSAGITMACALYSLARNEAVRGGLAMTGELTLKGLVTPVGGVKEKTLAARRTGLRELVLPEGNRKDFEELPAHIRKGLRVRFVRTFAETVAICFQPSRG